MAFDEVIEQERNAEGFSMEVYEQKQREAQL